MEKGPDFASLSYCISLDIRDVIVNVYGLCVIEEKYIYAHCVIIEKVLLSFSYMYGLNCNIFF